MLCIDRARANRHFRSREGETAEGGEEPAFKITIAVEK